MAEPLVSRCAMRCNDVRTPQALRGTLGPKGWKVAYGIGHGEDMPDQQPKCPLTWEILSPSASCVLPCGHIFGDV